MLQARVKVSTRYEILPMLHNMDWRTCEAHACEIYVQSRSITRDSEAISVFSLAATAGTSLLWDGVNSKSQKRCRSLPPESMHVLVVVCCKFREYHVQQFDVRVPGPLMRWQEWIHILR
jgi:hypothetical protein